MVPGIGPTWRIRDPARARYFEIGALEFAILADWSAGMAVDAMAQQVSQGTGQAVDPDDVQRVLDFLRHNQLLHAGSPEVRRHLYTQFAQSRTSTMRWLLHNYLFFRIPLWQPEPLLDSLARRTQWLYSRRMVWLLTLLVLVDLHILTRHWHEVGNHFDYAFNAEGLLLMALAGVVGKMFHELGHALTARRHGVRVPTIGVAFLVMFPMLYTDTSDSWRVTDKRKRLAITAAGVASELLLALLATLVWAVCPEGGLKTALFNLAFVSWLLALSLNASPFMRFDGYFLLSDALDLPNLHERSAALARTALRRVFFGIQDPDPEPELSRRLKKALVLFALMTTLYRLVVYLSITLLVYHAFFKLLGLFLMAVEIGWFIVWPVWLESSAIWRRRRESRPRWTALLGLAAGAALLGWLWLAATAVSAPALLHARTENEIRVPVAGLLISVPVRQGQTVAAGQTLALLASPEAALRAMTAGIRQGALASELERTAASVQLRERSDTLQQEMASAQALERLADSESDLLRLRSTAAGTVRDLLPDRAPGRWLRNREILMRVVSPQDSVIEAYVAESQVQAIAVGAAARFFPDDPQMPVLACTVTEIDATPTKQLASPLLASVFGGPIAAVRLPTGELVVHESRFRVRITPTSATDAPRALRGTVRIDGDGWRSLVSLPSQVLSTVLRESGF